MYIEPKACNNCVRRRQKTIQDICKGCKHNYTLTDNYEPEIKDGNHHKRKDYEYSWYIGKGSEKDLEKNNVKNLKKVNTTNIEDIYVGAIIVDCNGNTRKVLGNAHMVWFVSNIERHDDIDGAVTLERMKTDGCTLYVDEEEDIVELTVEDISNGKGKGIPAHLIRIKEMVNE